MEELWPKIYGYIAQYGVQVLVAVLIFLVGRWLAGIFSRTGERLLLKAKVDQTIAIFGKHALYILFMVLVIIVTLGQLGIQTASFVMLIGTAGLAVGLALQGTLSNFAGGVMLILFKTFKVGDVIETAGATGKVQEIQIFNTILLTAENKTVIIPNAKVTGDKITIHPRS